MKQISFTVGEGVKRFVLFWFFVLAFLVICLALVAIAGTYMYSTPQPAGMIGQTVYTGGRLIGSH